MDITHTDTLLCAVAVRTKYACSRTQPALIERPCRPPHREGCCGRPASASESRPSIFCVATARASCALDTCNCSSTGGQRKTRWMCTAGCHYPTRFVYMTTSTMLACAPWQIRTPFTLHTCLVPFTHAFHRPPFGSADYRMRPLLWLACEAT